MTTSALPARLGNRGYIKPLVIRTPIEGPSYAIGKSRLHKAPRNSDAYRGPLIRDWEIAVT